MKKLLPLALAACVAVSVLGCGTIEVRNPFAEHKPTALEASIAATQAAIQGATEWYVDACVMRTPGLATSEEGCAVYRDHVDPAVRGAHNTAIDVAESVDADSSAIGIAITAAQAAERTLADYATRYGVDDQPWLRALRLALALLTQRLEGALG